MTRPRGESPELVQTAAADRVIVVHNDEVLDTTQPQGLYLRNARTEEP